jgi:hypothetical protein
MATVTKRGNSFRITVSLGYDENYRQIRKTLTYNPPEGTAPNKARKLAEEQAVLFEQRVRGLPSYGENMTFSQLCDWFFTTIAPNKIRERTQDNYRAVLNKYILPTFRNTKLKDMTAARLDILSIFRFEQGRRRGGNSQIAGGFRFTRACKKQVCQNGKRNGCVRRCAPQSCAWRGYTVRYSGENSGIFQCKNFADV